MKKSPRFRLKCLVPGCLNKHGCKARGLCQSCYDYIKGTDVGQSSQASRNEVVKHNLRLISTVDERRRHVFHLTRRDCGGSLSVHDNFEQFRLLMNAVFNDNVDILEKWNKQLFVAREFASREVVHQQSFGGPRGR